jgi:hypothetical protein
VGAAAPRPAPGGPRTLLASHPREPHFLARAARAAPGVYVCLSAREKRIGVSHAHTHMAGDYF